MGRVARRRGSCAASRAAPGWCRQLPPRATARGKAPSHPRLLSSISLSCLGRRFHRFSSLSHGFFIDFHDSPAFFEVDWSSWECSESSETPTPAPVPSKETKWSQEGAESTFLTSSSGDLAGLGGLTVVFSMPFLAPFPLRQARRGAPHGLWSPWPRTRLWTRPRKAPSWRRSRCWTAWRWPQPFEMQEELLKEPYDLEALHAIDQKLAKMIPESEWEEQASEGSTMSHSMS